MTKTGDSNRLKGLRRTARTKFDRAGGDRAKGRIAARLRLMLLGITILLSGAILLVPLESWVHRHLSGIADRLAEHVYLPVARTALVVLFLYAIFPTPLLHSAELLAETSAAVAYPEPLTLLNVLFIAGMLLPLLPAMQRFSALILPLQTLIGAWLLSEAHAAALGLSLELEAAGKTWSLFVVLGLTSHVVIRQLADRLHRARRWDPLSTYDALALVMQPPIVLIVSRNLMAY